VGCMKVLELLEQPSSVPSAGAVSPCGCVPRRRALLNQLRSRHLVNTVLVNPVGTCGIGRVVDTALKVKGCCSEPRCT
jgi:hypothetical protein